MQPHLKTRPTRNADVGTHPGNLAALLVTRDPTETNTWDEQLRSAAAALGLRLRLTHTERVRDACEQLQHRALDVVLFDWAVVDAHGPEALERVRSAAARTPVVVLAKQVDDAAVRRVLTVARERQQMRTLLRKRARAATATLRVKLIAEAGRILATTSDPIRGVSAVAAHIVPACADCFVLCDSGRRSELRVSKRGSREGRPAHHGVRGMSNMITFAMQPVPGDVKRKIKEALERGVEFDADRITVAADGNTVTLNGTVRSYAEKIDAERAARNAPGVTEVKNKLTVDLTVPAGV